MEDTINGKSAAKPLIDKISNEESSTTISQESTEIEAFNLGKRVVYLRKKFVIYKILNITNGKFYIGSASYYDKRIGKHIYHLRRNNHPNRYLQNAWNKYKEESFYFFIIEETTKELLLEREQYWLDKTQCYNREIGYNIATIAENAAGWHQTKEAKIAIGNFWRNKKHSEERKARTKLDRTIHQGKKVIVYDKQMNFLFEFDSISETSRQTGISISAISKQCSKNNGFKLCKNSKYIFRYKDIV